jgi:cell division protein FtsB
MSNLPVREMVLYKHGVGFFVRGGALSGESLTLTFREDEINDVLKSLAVFDKAGGQVLGIHYPTPMDMQARLANSSINLYPTTSLRSLIGDLSGRRAELTYEVVPGTLESLTGRIMGMEEPNVGSAMVGDVGERTFVTLLDEGGQVRVIQFERLRGVRILDAQASHDLSYFLDTAVGDDARCSVHVRLSAGEHDLAVYYVAPSPVWRVSYRLVAESDEKHETGKALLQGWGLFDNRLEEDLENVRVSLIAGQPISFIYDLYSSTIPQRPTVRDAGRIAPGPIEYEGELFAGGYSDDKDSDQPAFLRARSAPKRAQADMVALTATEERARGITMASAQASAPAQAATKDAGEFFQYSVALPVSVKRGESALVPILSAEVAYTRELLYNRAKLPDHPVAALRFTNTTGLTLERGPVTVVEDGDYKGEAVVPFTRDTGEIYVPYAVELGIKITEKVRKTQVAAGIHFEGKLLVEQWYFVTEVTYSLENRMPLPRVVILETSVIDSDAELFDTLPPQYTSATERRWHVAVHARGQVQFTRKERTKVYSDVSLRKLKYEQLRDYLANRWIDEATFAVLSEVIGAVGQIQEAKERQESLTTIRVDIFKQQDQLRANLTTLQPTGKEAALRQRVLAQFEALQDRLDALNAEEASLKAKIAELEAKIDAIIAALPQKSS